MDDIDAVATWDRYLTTEPDPCDNSGPPTWLTYARLQARKAGMSLDGWVSIQPEPHRTAYRSLLAKRRGRSGEGARDMEIRDGGPAFPYSALQPDELSRQLAGTMYADNRGMSLRDYFAAKALHSLVRSGGSIPQIARRAYQVADAMLKARGE